MKKSNFLIALIFFTIFNSSFWSLKCSAQYTKIFDFDSINGRYPGGSLLFNGTYIYGTTQHGGTNDLGVVFKIKPDGTNLSKLLDFTGSVNGSLPFYGTLISDSTFLYGMTNGGGSNNSGVIFKIKHDGTNFSKLLDFTGSVNGRNPCGSLLFDGTYLYGMTQNGGTSNSGVVFKIKPDGTNYAKLLDFNGTVNGKGPLGSLIYDGTFLYGMTEQGGVNNLGTIFKIKSDGTGYIKLLDFSGVDNGRMPIGSLVFDGVYLYGMTRNGGTSTSCGNGCGVIFKIKPDGTEFSKLLDFGMGVYGALPRGSLIIIGTYLYGMTEIASGGGIFKIKSDGTGFSSLYNFSVIANGSQPWGDLISDGTFLYGMTNHGGTNGLGVIFKFNDTTITNKVNTNIERDFNVYPNPSNGIFLISNFPINVQSIEIYNMLGVIIYKTQYLLQQITKEIDISGFPKGIYFVKILYNDKLMSKKIMIH